MARFGFGKDEWRPNAQPYEPRWFHARLEEVFGDRLRIRWSKVDGTWHVEQKVGRAALAPLRIDEIDDSNIRARDGYALVMVVYPGTKTSCPICHLPLDVPVMETAEVTCENCQIKRRDARYKAGYFPLGEVLIDHLKKIDPDRFDQIERIRREDAEQARAQELADAAVAREAAALYGDALREQLPKAGFPTLTPDSWRH